MKHESFPKFEDGCTRWGARADITLWCEVRRGTGSWATVRLDDISQTGFRVAWLPGARPNDPLRIRIPGLSMLSARIVWQDDKAIGCSFVDPLHVAVFEHIVRQAAEAAR